MKKRILIIMLCAVCVLSSMCTKANIVIELDGSQHYEDEGLINDEKRTEYLEQYGIKVIRISNLDVLKNFEGVCQYIDIAVKESLRQPAADTSL